MNQIINMIIRQVMNQLVRRGVSAGFDQAAKVGQRRKGATAAPAAEHPQMTREERRAKRLARQQARQAREQVKVTNRISKF